MKVKSFEDLRIFQLAREINKVIWNITRSPKVALDPGIVRQMLDSAGSMMDNIAEGHGRGSSNEFKTFLGYSNASADELHSQLIRIKDRGCITDDEFKHTTEMIVSFGKQTTTLIKRLKGSDHRGYRLN